MAAYIPDPRQASSSSFWRCGSRSLATLGRGSAILARGGEVHSAVKKGTTYLVAGDKVGKAKLEAASKKGAEVIDEDRLRELLKG